MSAEIGIILARYYEPNKLSPRLRVWTTYPEAYAIVGLDVPLTHPTSTRERNRTYAIDQVVADVPVVKLRLTAHSATVIGRVGDSIFLEDPIDGDESPLLRMSKDGRYISTSPFWELPTETELDETPFFQE